MTLALLPVALALADLQDPSPATPTIIAPAVAAAPPAPAAAPPPQADAPELTDPMTDPASLTPIQVQAQTGPHHHTPGDPWEGFNRKMYRVNGTIDRLFLRPAAMGYKHAVPKPARDGLRNFFSNLSEPVVFVNYLLQLRIGKAVRTVGRFTINSTVGIGGLFDVAKRKGLNIPHHRNSFGDTLAWYGVGPGPYVFLPLVGPSTLRDALGGPFDDAFVPMLILSKLSITPFNDWRFLAASSVIPGLDLRAESDPELKALTASAVDPYASLRSAWLQNRAAEVAELHVHAKGRQQVPPELDNPLFDPALPVPPAPAPAPAAESGQSGQTSATISN